MISDEHQRVSVLLRVERWRDGTEHVVLGGVFDFSRVPPEAKKKPSRDGAEVIGVNQIDTFFSVVHNVAAFDVTP
jgi:hypothetical protein